MNEHVQIKDQDSTAIFRIVEATPVTAQQAKALPPGSKIVEGGLLRRPLVLPASSLF